MVSDTVEPSQSPHLNFVPIIHIEPGTEAGSEKVDSNDAWKWGLRSQLLKGVLGQWIEAQWDGEFVFAWLFIQEYLFYPSLAV